MTRKPGRLIVICLTAVASAVVLCAQSLDWYQHHDFGNRWEGLFGENQGSPEWELRSFVASIESYPMDSNVYLTIKYYVPDFTKAFIRATTIIRTKSYLMEAKAQALHENRGWRFFRGWKTKDVLLQKNIPSGNLGVLIRLGADSEAVNLFAPAIVYFSPTPKPVTTYRFDLFTAVALKSFSFEVLGQNGYHHTYPHLEAGAASTVSIEFPAKEIPPGFTRVVLSPELQASTSGQKLHLEWQFYQGLP